MGFDINYGPISTALLLANRAGQGQYRQQQFQDDQEFMHTLNSMQQTADARRATDMQNALGVYHADAQNTLAQAQLAQTGAYHTAELNNQRQSLANTNNYRQGVLANRSDNTGIRQQAQDDREQSAQQRSDAIDQLSPDQQLAVRATGRFAPASASLDRTSEFQGRRAELQSLQQQYADLQKQRGEVGMEEQNPITKAKTGKFVPRPGQEQSYNAWLAQMQGTQQQLQQKAGEFQQFLQGAMPGRQQTAAPPPPSAQQQQQTAAAASGGAPTAGNGSNAPVVNAQIAQQFLQLAHGDKNLARELAQRAGYIIPQQ